MSERIRIFIDFWNFQLQWNDSSGGKKLDWPKLPNILLNETEKLTGIKNYQYDGSKVYVSVNMTTPEGGKLKGWLKTFSEGGLLV